jgi:hypothetical protein
MLHIRPDQMALFEDLRRRQFENNLLVQLESDFPSAYDRLGEPGVRRLIVQAIQTGKANGVLSEGGVSAMAGLMMVYGTSFERSPDREWALGVLQHPRLPEQLKIQFLLERMASRAEGRVVVEIGD